MFQERIVTLKKLELLKELGLVDVARELLFIQKKKDIRIRN